MNFELQSLIIWTLTMLIGSYVSADLDAQSKLSGKPITLLYKIVRGAAFFSVCVVVCYGWISYEKISVVRSVAAAIFELNLWWIVFEITLNLKTKEHIFYISDDGKDDIINGKASYDDKLFYWLSRVMNLGPKFSGHLKFLFKILLQNIAIWLYFNY